MRPRTEAIVAIAAIVTLAVIAGSLGSRERETGAADLRRSTYLPGPFGASAFAESLELMGTPVERFRSRVPALATTEDRARAVYAALDPSAPLSSLDATYLRYWLSQGGSLLLAGSSTNAALRCFGYVAAFRPPELAHIAGDTLRVRATFTAPPPEAQPARFMDDGSNSACPPVPVARVDTLLALAGGDPVVLEVHPDSGGRAILVADGTLFTNRALRETPAGELVLGLVAGRYGRVIIDEYHHGYGPGGGMLAAVRAWSTRSPWGWMLWQLLAVAVIALLAGAFRFGPARRAIERRRRSPLEHVRALATALAAARGHGVAVGLLVQGLRRRLARPGEPLKGDPAPWLASLASRVRTPQSRSAVAALQSLMHGPVGADGVRRAALAVEDVWQDLKP